MSRWPAWNIAFFDDFSSQSVVSSFVQYVWCVPQGTKNLFLSMFMGGCTPKLKVFKRCAQSLPEISRNPESCLSVALQSGLWTGY